MIQTDIMSVPSWPTHRYKDRHILKPNFIFFVIDQTDGWGYVTNTRQRGILGMGENQAEHFLTSRSVSWPLATLILFTQMLWYRIFVTYSLCAGINKNNTGRNISHSNQHSSTMGLRPSSPRPNFQTRADSTFLVNRWGDQLHW